MIQNSNCIRLKSGASRSQVEHSTTESMGKAGVISGIGSYHIGVCTVILEHPQLACVKKLRS